MPAKKPKKDLTAPKPTHSTTEPTKALSGKNTKQLEAQIERLQLQCELLRKEFNYNTVQEKFKISDNDMIEMLTDENRKLNQRVTDLESAKENNGQTDLSAQNNSDSLDVVEKQKKQVEDQNGLANGATNEQKERNTRAKMDAMQKEIESLKTQLKEAQSKLPENDMETQLKEVTKIQKTMEKQLKEATEQKSTIEQQLTEATERNIALEKQLEKSTENVKTENHSEKEESIIAQKTKSTKDQEFKKKEDQLKNEEVELKKREAILEKKENEQMKKGDDLNNRESELKKLEAVVINKEKEVKDRESQVKSNEYELKRKLEEMEKNMENDAKTKAELKLQEMEKSMGHTKDINEANTKAELDQDLKKKENQLNNKEDELKKREETVKKNEDVLKKGEEALKNKDDEQKKKTDTLNSKENELKKREADVKNKEKEVNERQSLEQLLKDKESENGELNKQLSEKERDVADLQAKLRKQETTRGTNNTSTSAKSFKRELEKANIEIEELKTRLSKVVGAQITDGNPDIADLSDLNRPTKLAERYAELYDNEWTDAYEEIEGSGLKEEETIKRLLDILKRVYTFCQDVSKEYEKGIKTSALVIPGSDKGRPKTPNLPATSRKQIVELRKTFAPTLTEDVFKQYVKSLKQPLDKSPKTKLFVKTCIEICWLMSIQDPPVVLDTGNAKGPFDGDKYRTYTRSGKTFDYIVWPPLRLHEAGALLGKGVAQAK